MKIVDYELKIKNIVNVYRGNIPPSNVVCKSRYSDCFVFVLTGKAEYFFGGKRQTANAGDIIYLANQSKYEIKVTDDNYTFYFVDFFFENESKTVFENEIYSSKSFAVHQSSFKELYDLWEIGNFAEKIYCKSLMYQIYYQVVRSSLHAYVTKANRQKIERIIEYISENTQNSELSVATLSEMCGSSEVHFRRIFHQIYHISPIKFISNLRIKKAKELLTTTSMKISEISRICGFENQYYFAKKFKSDTHLTPTEYRAKYYIK